MSDGGKGEEKKKRGTYETGLESRAWSANLLLTISTTWGTAVEARRATLSIAGSRSTSRAGGRLWLLEGCWHDIIWKVQVSEGRE